jgi:tetratricopeptide (TPR) repeat protein
VLSSCVISNAPSPAANAAERGTRSLQQGDVAGAEAAYDDAGRGARSWQCWSNLAALALGLEHFQEASDHAQRAISLAPGRPEPWVNAAVASWRMGARQDAAKAMRHATQLAPGNATAAINYARMLRTVNRLQSARSVLATALARGTPTFELHLVMAEVMHVLAEPRQTRRHAIAALRQAVGLQVAWSQVPVLPHPSPDAAAWRAVLADCLRRLQPLDADACLAGGVVRMFALHGGLPEARKDIDIAIDAGVSHEALLAAFASGYRPFARQGQRVPPPGQIGVLGLVHEDASIPVDLLLQARDGGRWRGSFGPPDHLAFDTPAFTIGEVACAQVDLPLPMPMPTEEYLRWIYGTDWREETQQVGGLAIPRRYLQKGLFSPALDPASRGVALTRALLSLAVYISQGQAMAAMALCEQILAVEAIECVRLLREQLPRDGVAAWE